MQAVKYWEIDSQKEKEEHTIKGIGEELNNFKFKVKRMKDIYTRQEALKVIAYYNNDEYGEVVARIPSLEQDIRNLSNIGIFLNINEYRELYSIIRKNYYNFKPILEEGVENTVSDNVVEGVLGLLADAIEENEVQANKDGYYDIPTNIFADAVRESVFRRYNIADIKEALKIKGITKCNQSRNDYAVKVDGKTKRFIRLYKEYVEKVGRSSRG